MKEMLKQLLDNLQNMFKDTIGGFSIGRVSFGLIFILCCFYWMYQKIDPPSTMTTTLWALLGYVTSTKVVDLFNK